MKWGITIKRFITVFSVGQTYVAICKKGRCKAVCWMCTASMGKSFYKSPNRDWVFTFCTGGA